VDVEVAGRRYRVDVRRDGAAWIVTLDGREMRVDAVRVGGGWSLLFPLADGGPVEPDAIRGSYALALEPRGAGEIVAHVNGCAVPLLLPRLTRGARPGAAPAGVAEAGGPQTVTAPMPGRIVRVLVRPGDQVEARQPLVVIEAMKMQNELRAARAGTVVDVRIVEGALVEARALLVVLQ
jgi:hypothetical protein